MWGLRREENPPKSVGEPQPAPTETDEYLASCLLPLQKPAPPVETFKGRLCPLLGLNDLEIQDPKACTIAGQDGYLYGRKDGIIRYWSPIASEGPNRVYVESVNWNDIPALEQLSYLHEKFFQQYDDREVLMLVGKRHDGSGSDYEGYGLYYFIPPQVGTPGGVKWDAKGESIEEFHDHAEWVGTIHSHPGDCAQPSTTDLDEWADPLSSGVHIILTWGGHYTIHGAVNGQIFHLQSGSLGEVSSTYAEWHRSGDRNLEELLLTPPPPAIATSLDSTFETSGYMRLAQDEQDASEIPPLDFDPDLNDSMCDVGALPCSFSEREGQIVGIEDLWYVRGECGILWVMDTTQYHTWMQENPSLAEKNSPQKLELNWKGLP